MPTPEPPPNAFVPQVNLVLLDEYRVLPKPSIGTWEIAVESRTLSLSSEAAELVGWSGRTIGLDDALQLIHPDDRVAVHQAAPRCLLAGSATLACRVRDHEGSYAVVALHGALDTEASARSERRVCGTAIDITVSATPAAQPRPEAAPPRPEAAPARPEAAPARPEAAPPRPEELAARAFDTASTAMAICDPHTLRYLRVNDAMCTLVGRSRSDLLAMAVSSLTHPEDLSRDIVGLNSMLSGEASDYETEKRYIRPDGTVIWASVHVAPMRDDQGRVVAFLAQKIDITERREREETLSLYARDAAWLGRIRDAIDEDRLVLYWQPIVDLLTGETVQRELLLRMRDDDGRLLAPGAFLPVAERYGLVAEIDRWVVREAVAIAATGIPVEFNLSAASIEDMAICHELARQIEVTGADPSLLVIEITETAMLEQPQAAGDLAQRLRRLGCALALDDFGTGFATLSNLKHLPAAHLKIDMEFVRNVAHDETDRRLVRGIVGLAREFGLETIAEGIEDEDTLITLRQLGVDRGQGYLFARPEPVAPGRAIATPWSAAGRSQNGVEKVRALFTAFEERDLATARRICHPNLLLRPLVTAHADGDVEYRGLAGIERYFADAHERWQELALCPTALWEADGAVIAFGHVMARDKAGLRKVDALWVFRLRDGLLASIHAFDPPNLNVGPVISQQRAA